MLLLKQNKLENFINVSKEIISILRTRGHHKYKERCTMLSHSIQTGLIAKNKGCDDELILSGFLHDIGYLLSFENTVKQCKKEDGFENESYYKLAEAYLHKKGFSKKVIAPIANYMNSKRYLCFSNRDYYNKLSSNSKRTLEKNGGIMTKKEAINFEQHPYFNESILLLKIEQKAKVKDFIILKHHFHFIENLINSSLEKNK